MAATIGRRETSGSGTTIRRSVGPRCNPNGPRVREGKTMLDERKLDERVEAMLAPDETARGVVASDLDRAGNFGEQWVVATDKRLLVVQPGGNGKAPRNGGGDTPSPRLATS